MNRTKILLIILSVLFILDLQAAFASNTCTSDFNCSFGSKCLKDFGKIEGVCAEVVNQYGQKTYQMPQTESVQVGKGGNCSFDTDCSIGFECKKNPGQLKGFCIKK